MEINDVWAKGVPIQVVSVKLPESCILRAIGALHRV